MEDSLLRSSVCLPSILCLTGLLSAQNILNNNGFESGLMCYGTNIWSYSGIFGEGDYRLSLSPDAHSGNYSLEIGCGGADCFKAAAISNEIPTSPNQSYILSLYVKCPAGATATVFIPGTAAGDLSTFMICNGNWNLNTVNFQAAATGADFFFYLFSYYGGWARFDDVVLTYGDGTAPAPISLHSGNRNVSLSSQSLIVDGSSYLALGFFGVEQTDLAQVAALGANTIFGLGPYPNAACFNTTQEGYLDQAYDLGLNFVPDSSSTARLGVPAVYPAVMQQFAPHLANIAWMMTDEPDQSFVPFWYIDPSIFVAEYGAAKAATTLPLFADFQRAAWSVNTDVSPYAPGVDFFMAEPYGPDFQTVNHAVNMFQSLPPARPVWLAQDNPDSSLIVPKAYWALVNGVTGIGYFNWDTFKADPLLVAAAQQVFTELGQLKSVVFSQDIGSLVTAPPGIAYNARYDNGSTWILTANSVAQNVQPAFQVRGLPAGRTIQVMFENRSLTSTAGGFTDTFAGVARHVYVVNTPITTIAGSVLTKTGPTNARDWSVQIANSGPSPATGAAISSVTITRTGGTACTPSIVSTLPLTIAASIPAASNATGNLIINFNGCDTTSKFTTKIGLTADGGSVTGSIVRNNDRM